MKGGIEVECLSRKSRRMAELRPALIRFAKRSYWKRQRKEARRTVQEEAAGRGGLFRRLEHDPEKWKPVFRKDHAQTKRLAVGFDLVGGNPQLCSPLLAFLLQKFLFPTLESGKFFFRRL